MLLNNYFKITNIQRDAHHIVNIELNHKHRVYDGHFPGNPIAPGVCLVQMAKEVLETVIGKKLFMAACSNIKFTAILNPLINPHVSLSLDHRISEDGMHHANCSLSAGDTKFLSLKGNFKEVDEANN